MRHKQLREFLTCAVTGWLVRRRFCKYLQGIGSKQENNREGAHHGTGSTTLSNLNTTVTHHSRTCRQQPCPTLDGLLSYIFCGFILGHFAMNFPGWERSNIDSKRFRWPPAHRRACQHQRGPSHNLEQYGSTKPFHLLHRMSKIAVPLESPASFLCVSVAKATRDVYLTHAPA